MSVKGNNFGADPLAGIRTPTGEAHGTSWIAVQVVATRLGALLLLNCAHSVGCLGPPAQSLVFLLRPIGLFRNAREKVGR